MSEQQPISSATDAIDGVREDQPVQLGPPAKQGLYDPRYEHDACGVGFVVDIKGRKSHRILRAGDPGPAEPRPPRRLRLRGEHRRRRRHPAADAARVPEGGRAARRASQLPAAGQYGAGMVFLPRNPTERRRLEETLRADRAVRGPGASSAGARCRPTTRSLGETAKASEPVMRQVFIGRSPRLADEHGVRAQALRHPQARRQRDPHLDARRRRVLVHRAACRTRRSSTRACCSPTQLDQYFPDLQQPGDGDGAGAGPFALQHQHLPELGPRASLPLPRAQRRDQHAARQHQLDARPRGAVRVATLFGDDIKKILPIIDPNGSDSAMFDNVLELLVLAGRSLPHAMMMMIPEPWTNHESDERREARVLRVPLLPDGAVGRPGLDRLHRRHAIGAVLDRNGLRPSRYYVTKDDLVIMASEAGVLDIPPEDVAAARAACSRAACSWSTPSRAASSTTRRSSARSPASSPYRAVARREPGPPRTTCRGRRELPAAGPRHAAAAAARLRLHLRGPAHAHDADGARRRRSRRLDGQRHAAGRALGQAAAALQLLQAALRAGHQPADRLHPRGDHHVGRDVARLRRQPAGAAAGGLPPARAASARS